MSDRTDLILPIADDYRTMTSSRVELDAGKYESLTRRTSRRRSTP